ncbi:MULTISPECIES: LysR family transcriptional regulator [Paraburkholderia]|jgi:DNA-binding transcriptional LysR family regulator|uniref:LysR family transcriptional regulator n=2 Tax=Paraburkholderia largidicola TaxID=3014751 RepID=A0A7I8BWD2_9BURK|nr:MULTISPECIES: LysR family transcriptional regulator [Paraburkholderia]BCF93106.1 LysR family transcriptional regulator [Paraburkholderia sp. PGU16]CAG9240753.1 LysR family transcriptional regulator [Paraburkholderia caribensis]
MEMLLTAVDRGSLSAAARELKIPVSTLTRKVADLEEMLGTRLLIRTTRKLTLTDTGMSYVAAARRILDLVREQEREATGEFATAKGELVVTAPVQLGRLHVLPVINQFLAQYPDITVRLLLSDRNIDLIDSHADLALRIGELADSSMIATRIGSLRPIVCASPAFLANHTPPREPDDLVKYSCVVFNSPYLSPWRFRLPTTSKIYVLGVKPRLEVTTPDAAVSAAVDNAGITYVFEHDADEAIRNGQLEILLPQFEIEPVPVHLVHVSRNLMPIKLRQFIDFAAPKLRQSMSRFGKQKRH